MNILKSIFICAGFACTLLSPALSRATCDQGSAAGIWHTYGSSGGDEIDRCKIKINSSGEIVASASSCSARDDTGRFSLNIGGGNISISQGCILKGSIEFCEEGVCLDAKIEHGKLERDTNVLTLEGYLLVDPSLIFSYVGIKK